MRRIRFNISVLLYGVLSVLFLASFDNDSSWELKKDKDGISVYTRAVEGSSFAEFKGVVVVNSTLTAFVAMLKDVDSYPNWVNDCVEAKLLSANTKMEQVHYLVSNVPFPLDDRDMIVHLDYNMRSKTTLEIEISTLPFKVLEKENIVRIKEMKGIWIITQLNETEIQIQYQLHVNPSGSIPSWIANATVVDAPFYTLQNMREQIKNQKYQSKSFDFLNQ